MPAIDKSKRNKLAGSKRGTSKSAKYFQENKASRDKKNEYNKRYHATEERKSYRASLNKANRKSQASGKTKVGDGKDKSHTKKGKLVNEKQSSNRARNGKKGSSKK